MTSSLAREGAPTPCTVSDASMADRFVYLPRGDTLRAIVKTIFPTPGNLALRIYASHYETLRDVLREREHIGLETQIQLVRAAAAFATTHHPGRFADGAIENIALELGANLRGPGHPLRDAIIIRPVGIRRSRRVLHVATGVFSVGGHTRMINEWIRDDEESCHSVVLTDQRQTLIPPWLIQRVRANGGGFASLSSRLGMLQRAKQLRALAASWADVVMLHHGGFDVIPIAAFSVPGGPPVCVLNQADHLFWLGSSVADLVIDLREAAAPITTNRRFAKRRAVLPIVVPGPPSTLPTVARERLGLRPDRVMLLSVGRAQKYMPSHGIDFFAVMDKVLAAIPKADLYLVGITNALAAEYSVMSRHPRMHFCGEVEDPSIHRAAADIYLDSFPWGSATSVLEACLAALPVVLPHSPLADILVTNHGLNHIVSNPLTEEEYVERVRALAGDRDARLALGSALHAHVASHHAGASWKRCLASIYSDIIGSPHECRTIPRTECWGSAADIAICNWQAAGARPAHLAHESRQAMRSICADLARTLFRTGNALESLSFGARILRILGSDGPVVISMLAFLKGFSRRKLQRVLAVPGRLARRHRHPWAIVCLRGTGLALRPFTCRRQVVVKGKVRNV